MKTLLILRHGKAASNLPVPDHDRPLTDRGERQSAAVGQCLRHEAIVPELIVSSTADRARATAQLAAETCGCAIGPRLVAEVYLAEINDLIGIIRRFPDEHERVMLVGHNPGLEDLVQRLTQVHTHMSTAALAQIEMDIARWSDVGSNGRHTLKRMWQSPL